MAGGSYLDLVPLFDVSTAHLYVLFAQFLDWVLATFEFPLFRWLRGRRWEALVHNANQFAEKTGGLFYGTLGS